MILHSLLALTSVVISGAQATSFYIRPFSEFTQTSPVIVHGKLTNVRTDNSIAADGRRTIYTYANLEVREVLKGDLHQKSTITIRKAGGTKDGMTLEIPSSPEFKENDDTVLFLSAEKEDNSYEVLGLELGKFGLEEKNGEMILTGGIFNYSKPTPHSDHDEHVRAKDLAENQKPWSLTQLRTLIHKQSGTPLSTTNTETGAQGVNNSTPRPQEAVAQSTPLNSASPALDATASKESSSSIPRHLPFYLGGILLMIAVFSFLRRK